VAVRLRMKKLGRRHRPFFRVCAMDSRTARDGKPIEELGTYDPMVRDVDARAVLNGERIDYWLSVGAQPSEKVAVLIKKYGTNGTHLEKQKEALERLKASRRHVVPQVVAAPAAATEEKPAEEAAEAPAPVADATVETPADATTEASKVEEKPEAADQPESTEG